MVVACEWFVAARAVEARCVGPKIAIHLVAILLRTGQTIVRAARTFAAAWRALTAATTTTVAIGTVAARAVTAWTTFAIATAVRSIAPWFTSVGGTRLRSGALAYVLIAIATDFFEAMFIWMIAVELLAVQMVGIAGIRRVSLVARQCGIAIGRRAVPPATASATATTSTAWAVRIVVAISARRARRFVATLTARIDITGINVAWVDIARIDVVVRGDVPKLLRARRRTRIDVARVDVPRINVARVDIARRAICCTRLIAPRRTLTARAIRIGAAAVAVPLRTTTATTLPATIASTFRSAAFRTANFRTTTVGSTTLRTAAAGARAFRATTLRTSFRTTFRAATFAASFRACRLADRCVGRTRRALVVGARRLSVASALRRD